MEFTVVQGDIADQRADALINAAGTSLRMGNSVAGARIICEEIAAFESDSLEDVRFITYSDDEYETVRAIAGEVRDD